MAQFVQLMQQFQTFFGEPSCLEQLFVILPPVEQCAVFCTFLVGELVVFLEINAEFIVMD